MRKIGNGKNVFSPICEEFVSDGGRYLYQIKLLLTFPG